MPPSALKFISALQENGRVRVPAYGPQLDLEDVEEAIDHLDAAARLEFPGQAPPVAFLSAAWSISLVYCSAQFLVYREIDEATVRDTLQTPCPAEPSPSTYYSVDLAMQYLPDLISLARGIAEGDPLVDGLMGLAHAWPLSSVGVRGVGAADVILIMEHAGLRQLYIDRIIRRGDKSRLNDPDVAEAVRHSIGLYPALAPAISTSLAETRE